MGCKRQSARIRAREDEKEQEIENVNVPVAVAVQVFGNTGGTAVNVGAVLQAGFQNDLENRIRVRNRNRVSQR